MRLVLCLGVAAVLLTDDWAAKTFDLTLDSSINPQVEFQFE